MLVCTPKHTHILQMSEKVSVLDKQSQQPTIEQLKMWIVLKICLVQFMCNIAWLTLSTLLDYQIQLTYVFCKNTLMTFFRNYCWVKFTISWAKKSVRHPGKLVWYGLMIEIKSASLSFTYFMVCCFQWN